MGQVRKFIMVDGKLREFYFTKVVTLTETRYYITATDEFNKLFTFNMIKNDDVRWGFKESGHLPGWILNLEDELSDFINEINKF